MKKWFCHAESAKLSAMRDKNVLTGQRALRAYVLTCQGALRAYVLKCQRALRTNWQLALCAHVQKVSAGLFLSFHLSFFVS